MRVNIAVVGVGDFGIQHVKILKENSRVNLMSVCGKTEQRVRNVASMFDVPLWETEASRVFNDPTIDAVVIATAEDTHFNFTKEAVENGKHVLLEKPICLDIVEGEKLIKLQESHGEYVILPGHLLRYDASYCQIKDFVSSGNAGEILSITVKRNVPCERFSLHSRTHPVFMALSHDIDIILWLTNALPKKVYALQRKSIQSVDNPDIFFGLLEMDNGVLCQLETQWRVPNEYGRYLDVELEIMTSTGNIKLQYPGNNLNIMNKGVLINPDVTLWPEIHGKTTGALANEINSFIDLITGNQKEPVVTVREAVNGIITGHALIQSAIEEREINMGDW